MLKKSCMVLMLMMIKAAKLKWAGPEAGQQGWSKARAGLKHEQGRNRAGAELSRVKRSRQKEGRSWAGTGELGICRIGA